MHRRLYQLKRNCQTDPLFRNSLFLLMSSGAQAFFGFAFWLLVARLFTPAEVGKASTLISAMSMIAYLSLLGFNSTFVRFLPKSKSRNTMINTGLLLVGGCGVILAGLYILGIGLVSPELRELLSSVTYSFSFILLTAIAGLNLLTDSIFVAYRGSKYNFYVYSFMSAIKLIFPLALLSLSSFGIFASQGIAGGIAMALSLYFMWRHFAYQPDFKISKAVIQKVFHFSANNYAANVLNILPPTVLPLIIINKLGAAAAGYYYLAFMVATLLYTVAYAVSQSLFAEGSYGEAELGHLVKRAAGILTGLIVPASLALMVVGPLVLAVFGSEYGASGKRLVMMLALAAPAVAFYITTTVLLRITKEVSGLIISNIVYAITIIGLAFLWAPKGLVWVAAAWLIGHAVSGCTALWFLTKHHRRALRIAVEI